MTTSRFVFFVFFWGGKKEINIAIWAGNPNIFFVSKGKDIYLRNAGIFPLFPAMC